MESSLRSFRHLRIYECHFLFFFCYLEIQKCIHEIFSFCKCLFLVVSFRFISNLLRTSLGICSFLSCLIRQMEIRLFTIRISLHNLVIRKQRLFFVSIGEGLFCLNFITFYKI